jgi:hypothetical protein
VASFLIFQLKALALSLISAGVVYGLEGEDRILVGWPGLTKLVRVGPGERFKVGLGVLTSPAFKGGGGAPVGGGIIHKFMKNPIINVLFETVVLSGHGPGGGHDSSSLIGPGKPMGQVRLPSRSRARTPLESILRPFAHRS